MQPDARVGRTLPSGAELGERLERASRGEDEVLADGVALGVRVYRVRVSHVIECAREHLELADRLEREGDREAARDARALASRLADAIEARDVSEDLIVEGGIGSEDAVDYGRACEQMGNVELTDAVRFVPAGRRYAHPQRLVPPASRTRQRPRRPQARETRRRPTSARSRSPSRPGSGDDEPDPDRLAPTARRRAA